MATSRSSVRAVSRAFQQAQVAAAPCALRSVETLAAQSVSALADMFEPGASSRIRRRRHQPDASPSASRVPTIDASLIHTIDYVSIPSTSKTTHEPERDASDSSRAAVPQPPRERDAVDQHCDSGLANESANAPSAAEVARWEEVDALIDTMFPLPTPCVPATGLCSRAPSHQRMPARLKKKYGISSESERVGSRREPFASRLSAMPTLAAMLQARALARAQSSTQSPASKPMHDTKRYPEQSSLLELKQPAVPDTKATVQQNSARSEPEAVGAASVVKRTACLHPAAAATSIANQGRDSPKQQQVPSISRLSTPMPTSVSRIPVYKASLVKSTATQAQKQKLEHSLKQQTTPVSRLFAPKAPGLSAIARDRPNPKQLTKSASRLSEPKAPAVCTAAANQPEQIKAVSRLPSLKVSVVNPSAADRPRQQQHQTKPVSRLSSPTNSSVIAAATAPQRRGRPSRQTAAPAQRWK